MFLAAEWNRSTVSERAYLLAMLFGHEFVQNGTAHPAFALVRGSSHLTQRWRKKDSNLWSHLQRGQLYPARPFVFSGPAAPAAIVLISENDDFELPAARSNLARRAT